MAIVGIILGVLGLAILIIGLFYHAANKNKEGAYYDGGGVLAAAVGGLIFFVGIVTFGIAGVARVDEGEVLVPVVFGEASEVVTDPGLTFVNPFSRKVRMPTRTAALDFVSEGVTASGLNPIAALSAEGAQVTVDLTVQYHIDPTMADEVYRTVKTSWEEVLLIPRTRNDVRDCIPGYTFEEARTSKRGEASQCILDAMQSTLASRGIIVEDVLLRGMTADASLQAAIDQKLEAQSNAQRAEFEQREAIVRAETIVIEAQAAADAVVVTAQAEAEANQLIAESLTPELLQLRVYETLGDNTVYFWNSENGTDVTPFVNVTPSSDTP